LTSIFLVDDDIPLRIVFEELLTINGFDVVAKASNGREAVEAFKKLEKKPDIILMDHRMPIMDGIAATKEILKINRSSKIIFASADQTVKDLALSIGASSFKIKPFTIKFLIENIKKIV